MLLTEDDLPTGGFYEPQNASSGRRFSAAAFPYQAQRLTSIYMETYAIHSLYMTVGSTH